MDLRKSIHRKQKEGDLPHDAKRAMNELADINPEYKNANFVQVELTPKGNWRVYYDGKPTNRLLSGGVLSRETVKKLGWGYDNVD